ncbi:MAG: N-acetylmuramoyl-L-alanine amidase [Bacteroidales bacterium]|nr:N-acetylmuramoyl-L-alanine amidase [Bacteroidales bacterium]
MGSKFLWILDNGHSKVTLGKRSPVMEDGKRFFEYEFNRDIVRRISHQLISCGIHHHILVPETAIEVNIRERLCRANNIISNLPKIFITIHSNAFGCGMNWENIDGIETYYHKKNINSETLASIFHEALVKALNWTDRGLKTKIHDKNGKLIDPYILKQPIPAIMTATGFYTNKDECTKLLSDMWRERIANAHFEAIKKAEENLKESLFLQPEMNEAM